MSGWAAAAQAAGDIASTWYANRKAEHLQHQAQDWSAQQYATRYQTTVKDLQAAGLNPMLAYGSGPGSPPTASAPPVQKMDISRVFNESRLASAQAEKMKAETSNIEAEYDNIVQINDRINGEINRLQVEIKEIDQRVQVGKASEKEIQARTELLKRQDTLTAYQIELAKQEKAIKRPEEIASGTEAATTAAHVSRALKPLIDSTGIRSNGNALAKRPTLSSNTFDPVLQQNPPNLREPGGFERMMDQSLKSTAENFQKNIKPGTGIASPDFAGMTQTNFMRYYEHPKFQELGWKPYADNEAYYNANSTIYDDMSRMWGQFGSLVGTGFMSGYRAIGDAVTGGSNVVDLKSANEFEDAMAIGNSSRGGGMAWPNFVILPLTPALAIVVANPLSPVPASLNGDNDFIPSLPTVCAVLIILLPIPDACSLNILPNDLLNPPNELPKTNLFVKNITGMFNISVLNAAL